MIRIRQLSRRFGDFQALIDLDLDLDRGGALVLAGTNGSGRSTLLGILATLVRPTSGEVEIDGIDALREPVRVRTRIGYLGQSPGLHPRLSVGEHLEFVASTRQLRGGARELAVAAALAVIDLHAGRPIGELSPGLRQQLGLATALLGDPPLLLLDEPLSRLDPLAHRRFARLLDERRRAGATLVLACHSLDLPPALRERIVFLHRGRLLADRRLGDARADPVEVLSELVEAGEPAGRERGPEVGDVECTVS